MPASRAVTSLVSCAKNSIQPSNTSRLSRPFRGFRSVWQPIEACSCRLSFSTASQYGNKLTSNTTADESNAILRSKSSKLPRRKRIIVAITGATGAPLALELLHRLKALNIEIHLIVSKWGASTLKYELPSPQNTLAHFQSLAHRTYSPLDVSAPISSGSFRTDGMIIVPCSMKTLAAVRCGYDNDLISRAAGVTLKERRRLVLVARETPLGIVHLENMLGVAKAGATVFPPVTSFYMRPKSVQELVKQSVRRMVDALDLGEEYEDDGDELTWEGFDWKSKSDAEGE